jgi:hypothetical protein
MVHVTTCNIVAAKRYAEECVESDTPLTRDRVSYPSFAFGMYLWSDKLFLDLVWQYARQPTDARPVTVADQHAHPGFPNREAFFDQITFPPGSQEKRRITEDIVAQNVHHNPFMMREAMRCLATCLPMEPPVRRGEIHFPFRAFGRVIPNGREWISLVYRYARIPPDTTWANPLAHATSTTTDPIQVLVPGNEEDGKPSCAMLTSVTIEEKGAGIVDDGLAIGTAAYTRLYNKYIRNLALLEAAHDGQRALESAYLLRDPSDPSRCMIPVIAFGHHIIDDAQWFNLVYRIGRLPDDMSFVSTDALEE